MRTKQNPPVTKLPTAEAAENFCRLISFTEKLFNIEDPRKLDLAIKLKSRYKKSGKKGRSACNKIYRAAKEGGWEWCCSLCGKDFSTLQEITLDHIVPRSVKPTENTKCLLACFKCNSERSSLPRDFYMMFSLVSRLYPDFVVDAFNTRRRKREKTQAKELGMELETGFYEGLQNAP